jgi:hypothetical protein
MHIIKGRATAQAVSRWLPIAAARVPARSVDVRFVVDKLVVGQVFSEYFGFPCQSSFHQFLHHHNHPGQVQQSNLGAAVLTGPSWTPPPPHSNSKNLHMGTIHCSFRLSGKGVLGFLVGTAMQERSTFNPLLSSGYYMYHLL